LMLLRIQKKKISSEQKRIKLTKHSKLLRMPNLMPINKLRFKIRAQLKKELLLMNNLKKRILHKLKKP